MEKDDEFLHIYWTHVSQLCYEKAKEHVEKEKEPKSSPTLWMAFLNLLQQLALAEKNYMDIGFLQTKHKSFLRKDNSLRTIYEALKNDFKKVEDNCRGSTLERQVQKWCRNIVQYIAARVNLIDLYERIFNLSINKQLHFNDVHNSIEAVINRNRDGFTDISLTPARAVFSLECEILQQLFKTLIDLQRLQFLPSLALIHGAHTRLAAWESKMQSRESWKLGIVFKNSPLPALFQWLQKLKGTVLSKFSLYFHDTLAQQTTPSDMRHLCSKLHYDHYQKMVTFQRKYDASYVIILSDNQVSYDTRDYDSFPIIVSYPPRSPNQLEIILRMISDVAQELSVDKIIYKFSTQEQCTYVLSTVEQNIYLVILFENKKSEKDAFINHFAMELCQNLRCEKVFASLKNQTK
nr:unnamed protein product [Callosobruchus analis]